MGGFFYHFVLMRAKFLFVVALALGGVACTDKAYDLEKLNREMTFFEKEISIPVGSVGPITMESLAGNLLAALQFKTTSDGYLTADFSDDFYQLSAYELALEAPDPEKPFVYDCGSVSFTNAGPASAVSFVGLGLAKQKIRYTVLNPLSRPVTLNAVSSVSCMNMSTFETSYTSSTPLENVTLPVQYQTTVLQEIELPDNIMDHPGSCYLEDLKLEVPGDIANRIRSSTSPYFRFTGEYTGFVAIKDGLNLKQTAVAVEGLDVPLGRLGFKEVVLRFTLENTLPLDATLSNIKVLLPEAERTSSGEVNENIEISEPISAAGGTLDNPAVTPVTLRVKAKEGTLPDIPGVVFDVLLKTPSDCVGSLLSVRQGLTIQSATVNICGGIKLFGDE